MGKVKAVKSEYVYGASRLDFYVKGRRLAERRWWK